MSRYPKFKTKKFEPYYVIGLKRNEENRFLHFDDTILANENNEKHYFQIGQSSGAIIFYDIKDFFSLMHKYNHDWERFLILSNLRFKDFEIIEITQPDSLQREVKFGLDISI